MAFLGVFLLLFSWLGYFKATAKFTALPKDIILFLIFSAQSILLYIGGLIGFLLPTAYILLFGGILLLFFSIKSSSRLPISLLFFVVLALYAFWRLQNQTFQHYDNFSHWATIVKSMLLTNRLPVAQDTLIHFVSYPPGSAAFIYYVTRFTSSLEWVQAFAQALLLFSCILPVFSLLTRKKLLALPFALLLAWVFVSYNVYLDLSDLLVDTLLPAFAIGTFATFFVLSKENHPHTVLYGSIPLCLLVLIKNSGLLFAYLIVGWYIVLHCQKGKNKKQLLFTALIPLVCIFLWQLHVKFTFENGLMASHSLSVENITTSFRDKSNDTRLLIIKKFLPHLVQRRVFAILGTMLVSMVAIAKVKFLNALIPLDKKMASLPIFALVSYVLYQIGTLAMYLTSMSEHEMMASFGRYHSSIVIFIVGLFVIYFLSLIAAFNPQKQKTPFVGKKTFSRYSFISFMSSIVLCCLIVFLLPLSKQSLFPSSSNPSSVRNRLEQSYTSVQSYSNEASYENSDEATYLVIVPKYKGAIYNWCIRYLSWKDYHTVLEEPSVEKLEGLWKNYDYLLLPVGTTGLDGPWTFVTTAFPDENPNSNFIDLKKYY